MPWQIVERRIGRAGTPQQRQQRQRRWDQRYGVDQWAIGYQIAGEFVLQEHAIESIYNASYAAHFEQHPADLAELLALAKTIYNPHAQATNNVDLQVPAIMAYLKCQGLQFQGNERLAIGSWQGQASHPLSIRLSPLHIQVLGDPNTTLEQFWQEQKCLAQWVD
ncbi:hypothetical protein [Herpetosiphon gulosus]|uniref:Uncharacterized protein n=1 Tax=Herpetosiphon gulosus TaxID=1973496 RepID=A0ABP9WXG3_9CHLR